MKIILTGKGTNFYAQKINLWVDFVKKFVYLQSI